MLSATQVPTAALSTTLAFTAPAPMPAMPPSGTSIPAGTLQTGRPGSAVLPAKTLRRLAPAADKGPTSNPVPTDSRDFFLSPQTVTI